MHHNKQRQGNDVNGTCQQMTSVASGSGGTKASKVVIQRKPWNKLHRNQCKELLRIGTWNVRTMLRPGKLINVIEEMKRAKLDILGLSEVRWKEGGDFNSENVRVIYAGGQESQRGVAILISQKMAESVANVERYEDRIIVVSIKAEPVDIIIVQVYMPTSDYDEEEVDMMYDRLEEILNKQKGTNHVVLMGDWNAVIGEGKDGSWVGNYGLGKRNERGRRLVEFCRRQNLVVTNTWFKQEKRRRYTWKAPNEERYQLDYIMVRERFRNCVKNSHAYPGADADTDHNLVMIKCRIQLKFIKKKKSKSRRWNLEKLKTAKIEFQDKVDEKIRQKDHKELNVTDRWQILKTAITESARDVIGLQNTKCARKPWVTNEMILKMSERRKWKHKCTETAKREYRRLNNQLRRETDKAREQWWNEQCTELEQLQNQGKHDKVYERIKRLTQNKRSTVTAIRDRDGIVLTNPEEVRNRWKEYIEELYADSEPRNEWNETTANNIDDEGPELLPSEIEAAVQELKVNKSEGIDNIPAEMIKNLGKEGKKELVRLCQDIYNNGTWPEEFLETVMIPIPKKAHATECGDFRTISLICHATKIILKILTKRIETKVDTVKGIDDLQFGFRKGKGTRDAIGILRMLGERSLEVNKEIYVCFIDYEKAFDRVDWRKLMEILRRMGIDYRDRKLISSLYIGQRVKIRIDGQFSESGKVQRGVRQGCPLSPLLFNIYADELMREAMMGNEDGVKVGGRLIQVIKFADDQAITASTNNGLQRMMELVNNKANEYGMKINIKKTKVMKISKNGGGVKIKIDGIQLDQVKEFCYLGSIVTEDMKCDKEISRRIAIGKEAFSRRKELMKRNFNMNLRKRLVKTLIWPVALYGSETWTIKKQDEKRLQAFEMWIWRRMLNISWCEKKTNEEVLLAINEERSFMTTLRKRQKNWIGHVMRNDNTLRNVTEGKINGKKSRGRPRMKMLDWMMDTSKTTGRYRELKKMAQDRLKWRKWCKGPVK